MAQLVSKTYSDALFEVAVESNKVDLLRDELNFIVDAFNEYPKLFEIFVTPKVHIDEKKSVFEETFGKQVSEEIMNFIKVLLDKKRGDSIKEIASEFARKVDGHQGVVSAVIESAIELDEAQKDTLKSKLSNMTGKEIRIENKITPEVLGGIVVRIGDKIIDGSVKKKLDELKDNLKQVII